MMLTVEAPRKAWMNYKGLVELDLKTHDVELATCDA
jgi:hypothetical protein